MAQLSCIFDCYGGIEVRKDEDGLRVGVFSIFLVPSIFHTWCGRVKIYGWDHFLILSAQCSDVEADDSSER